MWVQSLGWEDPLEKAMETHSSILAWEIPWTEEPGGLRSMGSQRAGHDLATTQQHSRFTLLCEFLLYNGVRYMYTYMPSLWDLSPPSHPSRSPQRDQAEIPVLYKFLLIIYFKPNQKTGRRSRWTFLQRRHTDD